MESKIIAVIPAYEPPLKFVNYVKELMDNDIKNVVVVNDGSNSKYNGIFNKISELGATVISYAKNQGKGYALKTGFSYIKENFAPPYAIVTADCDGQHLSSDVITCANVAINNINALTLGVRDFNNKNVPSRSKFGNVSTRRMFKLLYGIDITDTQTGLRAFTSELIDKVLNVSGNGFEYEMNVLISLYKLNVEIKEVPIQTIYEKKSEDVEKRSHFRTIGDSFKVWSVLFKNLKSYLLALIISGAVEYSVFTLSEFYFFAKLYPAVSTLFSVIISRTLSSIVNYFLNFKLVFKSNDKKAILRYYCLWGGVLFASYGLVHLLANVLLFNVILSKLAVDLTLSIFSYYIQTTWVFPHKKTVA